MKKILSGLIFVIFLQTFLYAQPHIMNNGSVAFSSGEEYTTTAIIGQTFFGTARGQKFHFVTGIWSPMLLPPSPATVYASQGDYPNRNRITWAFDPLSAPADEKIQILRNGALLATVDANVLDFQDFNIIAGETYNYGIVGINEYGNGNSGTDIGFVNPNGTITGTVKTGKGKAVINSEVKVLPITGKSLQFGRPLDYVSIPITKTDRATGRTLGTLSLLNSMTVEFWMKPSALTNDTLIKDATSGLFNVILKSTGVIEFNFLNASNVRDTIVYKLVEVASSYNSKWYHVAITRDQTTGKLAGYINGEQILEKNYSNANGKPFTKLIIGKASGVILLDEMRLWKTAKSKVEIKRDYLRSGTTSDTNLVAYWNFNEGIGDYILDLSRNKFHGRLYENDTLRSLLNTMWKDDLSPIYTSTFTDSNGEFIIEGLMYGGGKSFNIVPELKVPSGRSFKNFQSIQNPNTAFRIPYDSLFPKTNITIEAWVKPTSFTNAQYILSSNYKGINLGINTAGRVFTKFSNNQEVISSTPLLVDKWNHVVMIIDNSGTRFIINNTPSGSSATNSSIEYTRVDTNYILIGGLKTVSTSYFAGVIDEVRIWSNSRLQAEIEAARNIKLKGTEDNLFSYFQFNEGQGIVAANRVKGHPNATLVKDSSNQFVQINSVPTISGQYYTTDIPNRTNEQIVHEFIPSQKRANLNSSITSVDRVEFIDATVIPVSGYVNYQGTECFVDSVEIYVDGKPTEPKTMTNNLGYYSVELDPGRDYRISAIERPGKNDFVVKYYDVVSLTEPVSLPMFIDRTKRTLTGLVAAALLNKEVNRMVNDPLSVLLDGVGDHLKVLPDTSLNLRNNFSIEAWVYPEILTGTNVILSKGNSQYTLAIKDSMLAFYSLDTNSWKRSTTRIVRNTWTHVAVTFGFASGTRTYTLFVNGKTAGTFSENGTTNLPSDNLALYLGVENKTALANYFKGNIAEVRLWNRTLDSNSIMTKKLQRLFPWKENGLLAYYTFSGESGNSLTQKYNAAFVNSVQVEGFPQPLVQTMAGGVSLISGSITNQTKLASPFDLEPTKVTVRAANGCLTKTVNVNADGTFTVTGLPPNYYIVSIMHPSMVVTNKLLPKRENLLDENKYTTFDFRAPLNAEIRRMDVSSASKDIIVPDRTVDSKFRNIGKVLVLTNGTEKEIEIGVFEDYRPFFKNASVAEHTNQLDTGYVVILDNISGRAAQEIAFGKSGLAYTILPTEPNISEGARNPFQKYIAIIPRDLTGNSTELPIEKWAIVKGSIGRERTFSTTSPVNLDLILHDPPGDQSYAKLEKGFTYSTKTGGGSVTSEARGTDIELTVGSGWKVAKGLGLTTGMDAKFGVTGGFKGSWGKETTNDNLTTTTVSFSEVFTTESSSDFIGAEGDVYIGHSDNIIYGNADILDLRRYESGTYDTLKINTTLFFFPGTPTYFAYPESFLEENLIPKLFRNAFLSNIKKEEYKVRLSTAARTEFDAQLGWDNDTTKDLTIAPKRAALRASQYYTDYYKPIMQNSDSIVFFNDWASNWQKVIAQNKKNKIDAKNFAFNNTDYTGKALPIGFINDYKKNLSFASGSPREYNMAITNSFEQTTTNTVLTDREAFVGLRGETDGDGLWLDGHALFTDTKSTADPTISGSDTTKTTSITYVLQDDDKGDNFSVNVWRDPIYATPVFDLVAAETSCPYEGPINGDTTYGYVTRPRDNIILNVQPVRVANISPGEEAVYRIIIRHEGQVDQDSFRTVRIRVPQEKNPNGAKIAINGVLVEGFIEIDAPLKREVNLMLTVLRGPTTTLYSGIELQAYACEEDRSRGRVTTASLIDFNFLEPCGQVALEMIVAPTNFGSPWVLTPTNADKRDTVKIIAYNYNVNDPNLTQLEFQYREKISLPSGSASGVIGQSVVDALTEKGLSLDSFNWTSVKGGFKPVVVKDDYNSTVTNNTDVSLSQNNQSDGEVKVSGSKEKITPTQLGDPRWIRLPIGKNSTGNPQDFVTVDSLKKLAGQFVYYFSLTNPFPVQDGAYEFRAIAVCNRGLVPGMSVIYTGVIDRSGPRVTRREPADGVLQQNDEISILFDENIDKNDIEKNLPLRILVEDAETNTAIDYDAIVYSNKITVKPRVQMSTLESKTLRVQIVQLQQINSKMVPVSGALANRPLDVFSTPSPARSETKWEFYVDQSPIRWSEDQITITTVGSKEFDPKTVRLKNDGGSIVNYSLINFPSWMEITPKSGSLAPGASVDITVKIRSSELGIGEKNSTIEVSTVLGIERLRVKVRKVAPPPTWAVNPSQFEKMMTMTAEVSLPSQGSIQLGRAMSFNGTTDVVTIPHNTAFNIPSDFTIEGWFLFDTKSNKNPLKLDDWHALVSKGINATNDYTFAIETKTSSSRLGFWLHGVKTIYSNTFNLDLNQFYHIAVTRSGGTLTFYVNGIAVGSQSGFTERGENTNTFKIGGGITHTLPSMTSGVIDEVRFWDIGRSSVEINRTMFDELTGSESNLIACYQFSATSGNTVSDITSNSFAGTSARSNAWSTNAPAIGNSRSFTSSSDELDMVAAFVGNQIRGVGNIRYVPELQKYITFLSIYSNAVSGEELSFRVWDASAGIEWIRIREKYKFVVDTNIGNVTTPAKITVDASVEKSLAFNQGWNWISFNTSSSDMSLTNMLPSANFSNADLVKSQTQFSQLTKDTAATTGSWGGTLTSFNSTSMFMANIKNITQLKYVGTPLNPESTPIALSRGWNWVGFTPQSPLDIQIALESIRLRTGDIIRSQTSFSSYTSGTGWLGNLNTLEPLKGYQLKLQDDAPGILTYPTPITTSAVTASASSLDDTIPSSWNLNPALFQYSMTMIGSVSWNGIDTLKINDHVGAFYGNECRGIGDAVFVPSLNKYRIFMMMYSNSPINDTLQFKYFNRITKKDMLLNEKIRFAMNDNLGTTTNPIQFTVSNSTGVGDEILPKVFALHQNYPNPFNPTTTIKYDLPQDASTTITIYSILGQEVKTVVNGFEKAGFKKVVWDGTNDLGNKVATGVYIYKIRAGKFTSNKKMIMLK